MALKLYATESMAYYLSAIMDKGATDYQLEAAICKIYASEAAWWVCDETIQVLGGMGYMKETGVERILRDLRIFRIFEGTNDILRLFVAGAGMATTGEKLKNLTKSPGGFLQYLGGEGSKRLKVLLGNFESINQVDPRLADAIKNLENQTIAFGNACNYLIIKYKKDIENQQMILKRVAESAMELFAMAAVISRAQRAVTKGLTTADHEILLADTFCKEGAFKIQTLLKLISQNTDQNLGKIADAIFKEENYIPTHPLGL